MAKLIEKAVDEFRSWVGQKWTCPVDGNKYEFESSDLDTLTKVRTGGSRDDSTKMAARCPCGGHIYFVAQSDGRGGEDYIAHHIRD